MIIKLVSCLLFTVLIYFLSVMQWKQLLEMMRNLLQFEVESKRRKMKSVMKCFLVHSSVSYGNHLCPILTFLLFMCLKKCSSNSIFPRSFLFPTFFFCPNSFHFQLYIFPHSFLIFLLSLSLILFLVFFSFSLFPILFPLFLEYSVSSLLYRKCQHHIS